MNDAIYMGCGCDIVGYNCDNLKKSGTVFIPELFCGYHFFF